MIEKYSDIILPVILKVPERNQALSGKDRVRFLSQYARKAVFASAQQSGIDLSALEKDNEGVPIPSNGFFWSLSHKRQYVGGVVSDVPIGIDIEPIHPVRTSLFNRIIDEKERQVAGTVSDEMFYRCWTAKEAVLKVIGAGLKALSQCKIHHIIDKTSLVVFCHQRQWEIEQFFFDSHVASVVRQDKNIHWILPDAGNGCFC